MYRFIKTAVLCLLLVSCEQATDYLPSKNANEKKEKKHKKDRQAPIIVFTAPTLDSNPIIEGDVRFQGLVSDDVSGISEYLLTVTDEGGTDWAWFTNEFDDPEEPKPIPNPVIIDEIHNLPAGTYTIHGHANDSAGHQTWYESQFHVAEGN